MTIITTTMGVSVTVTTTMDVSVKVAMTLVASPARAGHVQSESCIEGLCQEAVAKP